MNLSRKPDKIKKIMTPEEYEQREKQEREKKEKEERTR